MDFRRLWSDVRAQSAQFRTAFLAVYEFSATGASGLLILQGLLILCIWGMIGGEYGASSVVWIEPPAGTYGWDYLYQPLVWNGAAVATYFWISAYLIYLLAASGGGQPLWGWERFRVYGAKAIPPVLLTMLPACFSVREGMVGGWWRLSFVFGSLAASVAFNLVVWLLTGAWSLMTIGQPTLNRTRVSRRRRQLVYVVRRRCRTDRRKGTMRVQLQADALFAVVLLVYCGLVGYTLSAASDARLRWAAYPAFGFVVALVAWFIVRTRGRRNRMLLGRWIGGVAVAIALVMVFCTLRRRLDGEWLWPAAVIVVGMLATAVPAVRALYWHNSVGPNVLAYGVSAALWACLGGGVGFIIGCVGGSEHRVIPAAASICLGLAIPAVIYGVLRLYAGRWFYPAFAAGLGVVLTVGSVRPYPHHIDELRGCYGSFWDEDAAANNPDLTQYASMGKVRPLAISAVVGGAGAASNLQLDDIETLKAWHSLVRAGGPESKRGSGTRPLVIVTTSGGASVSALFTFRILTRLESLIPDFHRHVRIASGASGGMLGAALWRAWLTHPRFNTSEEDRQKLRDEWSEGLEADFIAPIIQGLAFKDIPLSALCPQGYADDRGRRLERAWDTKFGDHWKNLTFAKMRDEERSGRCPSLIFTPMMVEDGRPLYISTLDLDPIASPSRAPGRQVRGLEFLKLFPEAGWGLRVGTAARLSASFPYFSPAATLPTSPPRRLVDAGYLDNYGMAVALAWLNLHAVESTLLDGWAPIDLLPRGKGAQGLASRIVIIELRPYGVWDDTVATAEEREAVGERRWEQADKPKRVPSFVSPFQEFTTPPEGGGSARKAGMIARNEQLFDVIQSYAAARGFEIERVILKGELTSALNWSLPGNQIKDVTKAVDEMFKTDRADEMPEDKRSHHRRKRNRDEMEKLKECLK